MKFHGGRVPRATREGCGGIHTGAGERALSVAAALWIVLLAGSGAHAQTQIAHTAHNLSPSGRGQIRENRAAGVCIFCHTPHNARPTRSLWNRELPGITYRLYESSTLKAQVTQPTGSSRLCLSCHDGILALSEVRVQDSSVRFAALGRLGAEPRLASISRTITPSRSSTTALSRSRRGPGRSGCDPKDRAARRVARCNARAATIRTKTAGRTSSE